MQQVLNAKLIAGLLASALLILLGVASTGSATRSEPSHGRELKEMVVALDLELHTVKSRPSASLQHIARASKEAKAASDLTQAHASDLTQAHETVTSCMRYGTATSIGIWGSALAADPQWAAANGEKNAGLSKEQGCPDPSRLELWGSICYGRCPAGFTRTALCSCRA